MSSAVVQPQPQPVVVYPNTVFGQPPPSSHSHSNGSFGTVFIVLAVIIVISAIACCLGRLCNKRQGNKHGKPNATKRTQQNPNFRPKDRGERGRERESDLEFGLDKGFPMGRSAVNGDGSAQGKPISRERESDLEFGFDRGFPMGRSTRNGNGSAQGKPISRERESDHEFGFDKGFPMGRSAGNGDGSTQGKPISENGHVEGGGESYDVDGGQLKSGP